MIKRRSNTFKSTYEILDKSNIVLGIDSTVLYESFARGKKTIFFDSNYKSRNHKNNPTNILQTKYLIFIFKNI